MDKKHIYFDYDLQVWIVDGVVEPCGHPDTMRPNGRRCCNANRLAGKVITEESSMIPKNRCLDCGCITKASKLTCRSYPQFIELPYSAPLCARCQTKRRHDKKYQTLKRATLEALYKQDLRSTL